LAKQCKPSLTDEASAYIAEKYADLRAFDEKQNEKEKTMPVTARMMETMIRLSTAYAKSRISKNITKQDAENAYQLLCYACFKEKPKERREADAEGGKKRRRKRNNDGEETTEAHDESVHEDGEENGEASTRKKAKPDDVYDYDELEDRHEIPSFRSTRSGSREEEAVISMDRLAIFKRIIRQTFDKQGTDQLQVKDVIESVQKEMGPRKFTDGEVKAALERMSDDNAAMISEGKMILI